MSLRRVKQLQNSIQLIGSQDTFFRLLKHVAAHGTPASQGTQEPGRICSCLHLVIPAVLTIAHFDFDQLCSRYDREHPYLPTYAPGDMRNGRFSGVYIAHDPISISSELES